MVFFIFSKRFIINVHINLFYHAQSLYYLLQDGRFTIRGRGGVVIPYLNKEESKDDNIQRLTNQINRSLTLFSIIR